MAAKTKCNVILNNWKLQVANFRCALILYKCT